VRKRFAKVNAWCRKNFYPYKNEFEKRIHEQLTTFDYEDKKRKVKYTIEATYNPDFTSADHPWLLVEAKGIFQGGSKEASKYVWVKRNHPNLELIFIFDRPNTKAYTGCKRRADGSYLTLGEWSAKNGFAFFQASDLPTELVEGTVTREWLEGIKRMQRLQYGFKVV